MRHVRCVHGSIRIGIAHEHTHRGLNVACIYSIVYAAERYDDGLGVRDRVEILVGNSLDLIDQVDGDFDIIFNDVDKHYYPEVHRKVAGRVRVGGLLVTDNTLWSGKVADLSVKDSDTEGVRESNKMLYADDRYCPVLIPLRDGVAVGLRVK